MKKVLLLTALVLGFCPWFRPLFASEFTAQHTLDTLKTHCADCHSGEKAKGQFNLTTLNSDFKDVASVRRWERVLMRLESGEMPPPDD